MARLPSSNSDLSCGACENVYHFIKSITLKLTFSEGFHICFFNTAALLQMNEVFPTILSVLDL